MLIQKHRPYPCIRVIDLSTLDDQSFDNTQVTFLAGHSHWCLLQQKVHIYEVHQQEHQ